MPDIILHNYPQSPVAEKVRVALGIKGAEWASVEIPRLPPKPMLTRLTGGYRRTPVMQIGADIYCDSRRILSQLDGMPGPRLYPADPGSARLLDLWAAGELFDLGVKLVLGGAGDALPRDFAEDRGRLYLGPDWADGLKKAHASLPHLAAQMRARLSLLEDMLADGRRFLTGDAPAALDAQIYHVVWFIRGRWDSGPALLAEFRRLEAWEAAVRALGHGDCAEMSPEDAIARAAASTPAHPRAVQPGDPQGLTLDRPVTVSPDVDGGEQPVEGAVWAASADAVSVLRSEEGVGDLVVHFPRAGYRIEPG